MLTASLLISSLVVAQAAPAAPTTSAAPSKAAAPAPPAPDVIAPNENLVTDGVPKIPTAIAAAVGGYAESRAAGFLSWHPKRREMLISTRFADTPQIHRVAMPGGDRKQLTFFADRVGGAHFPPKGDGASFVFSKDIGGNEFFQTYRFDVATGAVTLLTDGKSRNSLGRWSNAGDRIAYTSTRRNGKDTDLYVVAPADPKTDHKLCDVDGGGWSAVDWSPDDKKLLVSEGVSVNESYLWIVDVATGEKTLLTPKGGPEKIAYGDAAWSRDGKAIYATTDKESEFSRLARIDPTTKAHTYLTTAIKWDVEGFDLSPDGKTIAFVANEDGVGKLHLLDTKSGKEKPAPKLPIGQVGGVAWHPDGKSLSAVVSGARSTSDVYSIDARTNKVERWTESETGGINPASFSEPEIVRWKSFDGREISAQLYKPPAKFAGPRPLVVNIHGGPEGQSRPGFQGRQNYLLNELGVAILYPNVRGSTGYGKTFTKLDNGFLREDSVRDIGAALDWVKTRPDLDADRIMVVGGSYGGYMSLAVSTWYSDRIRCSIDVVGISNFVSFLERTEAYRRDLRRVEYGDERDPKMREFMVKIAPLNNAAKIKKPIFIVQGKNDPRVPLNEAEQMVAQLKKQKTPVWYLMAKDEGHGFAKKKNADFQFYATIAFMQEHLLK